MIIGIVKADGKIKKLADYLHNYDIIRRIGFGAVIYDVNGIAVTGMDYCVQSTSNTEDIRSLIYHQDGHMYTTWDSPASILW